MSIENTGKESMQVGLGLHPCFPRTARTTYLSLHRTMWTDPDEGLPTGRRTSIQPQDWWDGEPVAARPCDTAFSGRVGSLRISWPERKLALVIEPSANLTHAIVFNPDHGDFFCLEPATHGIDAVNALCGAGEMATLEPSAMLEIAVRYSAERLCQTNKAPVSGARCPANPERCLLAHFAGLTPHQRLSAWWS